MELPRREHFAMIVSRLRWMFHKAFSGKPLYISAEIVIDGFYLRRVGMLRHRSQENSWHFA